MFIGYICLYYKPYENSESNIICYLGLQWNGPFFGHLVDFIYIFIGIEIQSVGHMSKKNMQKKSICLVKHFFHFLKFELKIMQNDVCMWKPSLPHELS